jgi:hypothetical protein
VSASIRPAIVLSFISVFTACPVTARAESASIPGVRIECRSVGSWGSIELARPGAGPGAAVTAAPAGTVTPASVLGPQTTGVAFTGVTLAETNVSPPDIAGAVGPRQFLLAVNGRLRSFSKTTGLPDGALDLPTDTFFAPAMTPVGGVVLDNAAFGPQVRYDRHSARWFVLMTDLPCTNAGCSNFTNNRVMMAMSDGSVLKSTTVWTFFTFQAANNFLDFRATLAVDAQALYVGTLQANLLGTIQLHCPGYVIQKSSLLSGGPAVVTQFADLGIWRPWGANQSEPGTTEGCFLGVDPFFQSLLRFRRVTDPGGTPTISSLLSLVVPTTSYPTDVAHLGGISKLDGGDDQLCSAEMRDGRLWTCHAITVDSTGSGVADFATNGRTAIRWYELTGIRSTDNGGVPALVQAGTIFDNAPLPANAREHWMPSLALSGQKHVAVGFSTAGAAYRVNAGFAGRLDGDAPGTMSPVTLLTASSTSYIPGPVSWGRYSATSVDPLDDMTMWTAQQFCDALNSYGVRVTQLLAPPPATPTAMPDVTIGLPAIQVALTGSPGHDGAGYFDPGPNLPAPAGAYSHLRAIVTTNGATGVPPTVLATRVVSPTELELTLDTSAATLSLAGQKYTVVVTNPDGQVAQAAVLRVVAPAATVPPGVGGVLALDAPAPNPSAWGTRIGFALPRAAAIRLELLDLAGRVVAVLAEGERAAGRHEVSWEPATGGARLASGLYWVRLQSPDGTRTRRLAIAR